MDRPLIARGCVRQLLIDKLSLPMSSTVGSLLPKRSLSLDAGITMMIQQSENYVTLLMSQGAHNYHRVYLRTCQLSS
jgi:hypothetical protein